MSGTVDVDGAPTLVAGVQLRMDPGWKTYWRNPGDSGVPPSFDWTGSKNLKHAEVLYPAPHRFADAGGTAIGYDDEVVFPVKLTPEREGEPIELKLAFAYGLCKDLCIPNDVSLGLTLPAQMSAKGDALLLESVLARVPKPARDGVLPSVSGVEAKLDAETAEADHGCRLSAWRDRRPICSSTAAMCSFPCRRRLALSPTASSVSTSPSSRPPKPPPSRARPWRWSLVSDQGSTETSWKAE